MTTWTAYALGMGSVGVLGLVVVGVVVALEPEGCERRCNRDGYLTATQGTRHIVRTMRWWTHCATHVRSHREARRGTNERRAKAEGR